MHTIQGVIRDYEWGDPKAIAELLGHEPPGHPEAEYWLGAHPSAPSRLVGLDKTLDDLVAQDLVPVVGDTVSERFSGLPFLLKILAADRPLSIQAHPSLAQAAAGFDRENAAGIDVGAPNRSYRDANHKPELICALTPFEAKCGFRSISESRRLLSAMANTGLEPLAERLAAAGPEAEILADTVSWLLTRSTEQAAVLADAALDVATRFLGQRGESELSPFATEMRWTVNISESFPGDIGIVVALLLNHVSLEPGQAIFLEAGNLHSYLKGVGVEIMANSDNVLRGGLTPKHINVDELLSVVDYTPGEAPVQVPSGPVHTFESPVPEFSLTRLDSTAGDVGDAAFEPAGPAIILVTSGALSIEVENPHDGVETLAIPAGSAAFIRHDDGPYRLIDGAPGQTIAWRAAVGSALY